MAAWLSPPVQLHSMRMFECGDMSVEDCDWYKQHWHFWYIADYVFALPTIAFFMCTIGIFIIGHALSSAFVYKRSKGPIVWQRLVAVVRYLAYRGFHITGLGWSSAPLGVLILGLIGTIFFFCMVLAPKPYYWSDIMFGGSPPLATRSGWLALACMPFIFATATKTNWITLVTGVSHERLQVFHRWISYAFFILALLHTFPCIWPSANVLLVIVYHIHWHDMEAHFTSSLIFYWTGIVALIFQAWLTFASHSTIRRFGYEFFKATHLFAAVVFMVTFLWHCDYTLTSWDYFIATAAIYVPCCTYPWLRTCFEYGLSQKALISVDSSGFIRVAIPATFDWTPGQHCFLRFTSFGLIQAISSHPFTICSSPSVDLGAQSELVFYIRPHRGLTAKLHAHALANPASSIRVLVDGPYGGISTQSIVDADHALVIAGGSGAGWCLPFVEQFIRSHRGSREADLSPDVTSRIEKGLRTGNPSTLHSLRVVLATRDPASRKWFLGAVDALLAKHSTSESLLNVQVEVHLTGRAAQEADLQDNSSEDASLPSDEASPDTKIAVKSNDDHQGVSAGEIEGRPQLATVVKEEAELVRERHQSLSVFVCGPITMHNDVRNAVAAENLSILRGSKAGEISLYSEHFSWA